MGTHPVSDSVTRAVTQRGRERECNTPLNRQSLLGPGCIIVRLSMATPQFDTASDWLRGLFWLWVRFGCLAATPTGVPLVTQWHRIRLRRAPLARCCHSRHLVAHLLHTHTDTHIHIRACSILGRRWSSTICASTSHGHSALGRAPKSDKAEQRQASSASWRSIFLAQQSTTTTPITTTNTTLTQYIIILPSSTGRPRRSNNNNTGSSQPANNDSASATGQRFVADRMGPQRAAGCVWPARGLAVSISVWPLFHTNGASLPAKDL